MSVKKEDVFEQLLRSHLAAHRSQPLAEPCPDENWMTAYLEGSQGAHFKRTFEQHLLRCDRCRAEMALLLKNDMIEPEAKASAKVTAALSQSNILASLFTWTRAAAFRPAFAILLVSIVTGTIGYRVLRQEQLKKEVAVDLAQSAVKNSAPVAVAPESSPSQPQAGQTQILKPSSVPARREAERDEQAAVLQRTDDLRSRSKMKSSDQEMKDSFAVEPPSAVPAESANANVSDGPLRREAPRAASESLQKESLPAPAAEGSTGDRRNTPLQAKTDQTSGKPQAPLIQPATPPPLRSAPGALSGRKAEQEKLANAEESRAASTDNKKQMVGGERVRQTAAFAVNEASPIKRIEAGGKRFDLTDGVWTDSAILPEDPAPALLNVKSTDFERLRKEFAPYLALISRPEDVLIKLDNQVFRIKKAR